MKTFPNELGNEIKIVVTKKEINGVRGVLIYIEGTTSTLENHITFLEAKELLYQLNGLIGKIV